MNNARRPDLRCAGAFGFVEAPRLDLILLITIQVEILRVPTERTTAIPTALQIAQEFEITKPMLWTGYDIGVKFVDLVAEPCSKTTIGIEIIHEIVQDPMSKSGKSSNPDDSPIIFQPTNSPPQSCH
jgi:hypothetical protein